MEAYLELAIEEILTKSPEEIKRIYEEDLKVLKDGKPEAKRKVAQRHALYYSPLESSVEEATLYALHEAAKLGEIDGVAIQEARSGSPSFDSVRTAPDGKLIWKRGLTVESMRKVGDKQVTVFYSIFDHDARRKRASNAQEFVSGLVEHARELATDIKLIAALEQFKPQIPIHRSRNILANMFIDGKTLHEVIKEATPDVKYALLAPLTRVETALHHYAQELFAKQPNKNVFVPVNHAELLLTKGVARNYPAFAEKLKKNSVFASILGDLNGIQSFVHGDAIPANTVVTFEDCSTGRQPIYHPIDLEEASLDFHEAPIVQRLLKSGAYDSCGEPVKLQDGSTLEAALLGELQAQMKKLEPCFDVELSRKRFNALKAEQLLIWASRYKAAAKVAANEEELALLSRYYYTLFCKEVVAQGRVNDTNALTDLSLLFKPLSSPEMDAVYEKMHPGSRSVSVFKVDAAGNAEERLEERMKDYAHKKRMTWAGRIGAGLAIVAGIAGIFGYQQHSKNVEAELAKAQTRGKYAEKVHIIRLAQSRANARTPAELYGLDELRMWGKIIDNPTFADVAFIDYTNLYSAQRKVAASPDSKEYERDVLYALPPELYSAVIDTQYTIDAFMRSGYYAGSHPAYDPPPNMPYASPREKEAYDRIQKKMKAAEESYNADLLREKAAAQGSTVWIPSIGEVPLNSTKQK